MGTIRTLAGVAAALCVLAVTPSAWAAPGDLDPSFDGDGRVKTGLPGGTSDVATEVAIQADGKIVVAGRRDTDFAVVRYNPDGSLDGTFDDDGWVTTDFGGTEFATAVAIQADGKIVVVGTTAASGNEDFTVVRYTATGGLDMSFGGTGKVVTNVSTTVNGNDRAEDVAIQADGKIVVGGWDADNRDFALVRYESDGDPDSTFDGNGIQTTDFGTVQNAGYALAIQPDGKLVLAGYVGGSGGKDHNFAVARYTTGGAPDSSFSGDGRRTTDLVGGYDLGSDLAIQPSGRIVVGGNTELAGASTSAFALAGHDPGGALDASFGQFGTQTIGFGGHSFGGGGLVAQPDGKLLQAGSFSNDFAVARLSPDGQLDASFNGDGRQTTDFGGQDFVLDIALQPDGKLVAAGTSLEAGDYDFAVARYLGGNLEVPAGGGTGGVPPAPPPPGETALGYLGRSLVRVSRTGRFALVVQGPSGQTASIGLRSVRTFRGSVAAQRRARPLTLGSKRFNFGASGRATVRFRLSRKNLRVLRRVKRLRTRATATAGAQRTTFTFTLRAPAKR